MIQIYVSSAELSQPNHTAFNHFCTRVSVFYSLITTQPTIHALTLTFTHTHTHMYVFTSPHPHFICWLISVLAFHIHSIFLSTIIMFYHECLTLWFSLCLSSSPAADAHTLIFSTLFFSFSPHTQTYIFFPTYNNQTSYRSTWLNQLLIICSRTCIYTKHDMIPVSTDFLKT